MRRLTSVAPLLALVAGLGCSSAPSSGDARDAIGSPQDGATEHAAADAPTDHAPPTGDGAGGGGGAHPDGSGVPEDGGADARDGAVSCLGPCLDSLYAECPKTMQTCVSAKKGNETAICYSNGVKEDLVQSGSNLTATVKKANGDPCYVVTSPSTDTEDIADATGTQVAHIQILQPSTMLVVTCMGSVTHVDLRQPECAAHYAASMQTCTAGACTWP
jgi:hypothetical protein